MDLLDTERGQNYMYMQINVGLHTTNIRLSYVHLFEKCKDLLESRSGTNNMAKQLLSLQVMRTIVTFAIYSTINCLRIVDAALLYIQGLNGR